MTAEKLVCGEELLESCQVFDVNGLEAEAFPVPELVEAVLFDADIIVVVEVVDTDDGIPRSEQQFGGFAADKPGRAGDENGLGFVHEGGDGKRL